MDEPTSGLDPNATAAFTKICKELAADGKTIFMTTHDIFNAVNVGTRIGITRQGELVHQMLTQNLQATNLQKLYLETIKSLTPHENYYEKITNRLFIRFKYALFCTGKRPFYWKNSG